MSSNREGFIEQAAEEFVAAMRLYHETYGQSSWIKDWSKIGTHSIIDSSDGGKTGGEVGEIQVLRGDVAAVLGNVFPEEAAAIVQLDAGGSMTSASSLRIPARSRSN